MASYASVGHLYAYLATVPVTPETTALLSDLLARASSTIDEHLPGMDPAALIPVPPSLEQVCLELAAAMYRVQDQGVTDETAAGHLTDEQLRTIRQVRIRFDMLAF